MKSAMTALLLWLTSLIVPVMAATDGDFENRLRAAESAGDRNAVATICQEWYASGQYSPGLLNWNYNALMSVEQNALLFTLQGSDTYPAMLLQNALNVRPDVCLISFEFIEAQEYRKLLIDREGFNWIPVECSLHDFVSNVLMPKSAQSAQTRPVYFGSMVNKNLTEVDKRKLYLTGLALKFSPEAFDNVAALRYNFENRFRTDYLDFNFGAEPDPATVARVNMNYVPAFLLLHRHYSAAGETDKAARLRALALRIAAAANREAEVRAFFEPEPVAGHLVSTMTPRMLEKPMKKVGNKLYASETELSNAQYEAFLTDLLKNKDFEQLDLCRTTKTDWVALLPKELQQLPEKTLFKHGHPDQPDCPVQNISHEAAQRYCAWITQVYNASPEKKKYKKVLFRLPTEAEWMAAARAGRTEALYPWGGAYVRNSKGCYLGNYNATEPCGDCPNQTNNQVFAAVGTPTQGQDMAKTDNKITPQVGIDSNDGGFFAVPVTSYYPNDFGLYSTSGNVAEMISEPGKVKGGSWQDDIYHGQIGNVRIVNGPSPAVGFRVFMEVIEE